MTVSCNAQPAGMNASIVMLEYHTRILSDVDER